MPKKFNFFIERSVKIDNHMWANGVKSVGKNMAHSSDSPPTQLYPLYAPEDYKKKDPEETGEYREQSDWIQSNYFYFDK